MATRTEMIAQVRALLNEASAAFWTDTEIGSWIDQAALDLSTKARCVETSEALALTTNVQSYPQPTGAVGIEAVMLNGVALVKSRLRQFGHSSAGENVSPSMYAQYQGWLHFFPSPKQDMAVIVFFWKQSISIDDLPDAYENLVQLYALMKARVKEEKYQAAAQLYTIYIREMQFLRNDLQDRQPDSQEMIRLPHAIRTVANA